MKDLLKEAIADAKAVKQTALANAKLALEEAFTPRLQSMLSAKLAEELSEEEEEVDEPAMTEEDEMAYADNEAPVEEGEEGSEEAHSEEEMTEEEEAEEEMTEEEDDDLDLEEIIRELEGEDSEEEVAEPAMEEGEEEMEEEPAVSEGEEGDDEDIDINEIIRSLREEDEEAEEVTEEEESSEELEEAYNVIRFLKGKINEVNLLNAKLLYSNKLFRNFALNEGQKMKVIENFDRAHNLREVKLVFSTLAEGFKSPSIKKSIKESYASKPVASTKPAKRILSEGADLANRFQKLAGLKK
jgi:hypothetical protein